MQRGYIESDNVKGNIYPHIKEVHRPDERGYGGIFGTLVGVGLTVVEGLGYWYLARKGIPNILVLALPLATNAVSGLYEYGTSVKQRLIERNF